MRGLSAPRELPAIRQAGGPRGIYPSDIGCYTRGIAQEAVDTCHDMGAAVSMAAGFHRAFAHDLTAGEDHGSTPPIIASIGDSTFFHGGLPPLADAIYSDARFTQVILGNLVTGVTGRQPTLHCGVQADGSLGTRLSLEDACRGLGVRWLEVVDPYDTPKMVSILASAIAFNRNPEGGLAVVIARRPCVIHDPDSVTPRPVEITDRCNLCGLCFDRFGCPAFRREDDRVSIDRTACVECGACVHACQREATVPRLMNTPRAVDQMRLSEILQ